MKIVNPKKAKKPTLPEQVEAEITSLIDSLSADDDGLSFDEIREAKSKTPDQWPDKLIHRAAINAGLIVAK